MGAIRTESEEEARDAMQRQYEIETAAPREWDDPGHAGAAMRERIKGAKDDGFIPFDPGKHTLKPGDVLRFKEAVVTTKRAGAGMVAIRVPGWGDDQAFFAAIESFKRAPEPLLKVGDFARHPSWGETTRCEIAVIRDGVALFWPPSDLAYPPRPYPVSELERVK